MTGFCDGAATAIGRVRRVNEDSYLISPALYAVADGLFSELTDDQIVRLLTAGGPQHAADSLVAAANDAGGRDNITVIVVDVDQDEDDDQAAEDDTLPRDQLPGRS